MNIYTDNSKSLKQDIIDKIQVSGDMSVAQYMELCVAHYYSTRDPFGKEGDFTTSPEISQVFGELIGAWLLDMWQHLSASHAILCEAGPGRGTLMKDILRVTRNSGLHESIDVRLIETSPVLRELQMRTLNYSHSRISWHNSLESLPELPLYFVANEFFDALPVHQYVGGTERKITHVQGNLLFLPDGDVTREESPVSLEIIQQVATHIKTYGGAALIIDYGYESEDHGDSLQALKAHKYVSPLDEPGEADITAHVDFLALKKAAAQTGANVFEITCQGDLLKRLGVELRAAALCRNASQQQQKTILSGVERLVSPEQMGILFKAMAITSDADRPAGF